MRFQVLLKAKEVGQSDREAQALFPPFYLEADDLDHANSLVSAWFYVTWCASGKPGSELVVQIREIPELTIVKG